MLCDAWQRIFEVARDEVAAPWLPDLLRREASCEYLRRFGSPRTPTEYRERVPPVSYEELEPWLRRVEGGASNVLFRGRPVAYERTGGSTCGPKLVPYTAAGLRDFRRALVPWLARTARRHQVQGRVYLSLSPATRPAEAVAGTPVGLPDSAYLGPVAGAALAELSVVPLDLATVTDVGRWRALTLQYLTASPDLELISVWSPTFLLRLLAELGNPVSLWPRLRVVSCWASAESQPFADTLARLLPQAHLQPKGLVSTECVVTVPGADDRPLLNPHGYFEFESDGRHFEATSLIPGESYSVLATTASGLYRYRTGDLVRCLANDADDGPSLEFVGRGALVSDLAGEKLHEAFVSRCLAEIDGFRFLAPSSSADGYVLYSDRRAVSLARLEARLRANPQYAHARNLGQLAPLAHRVIDNLFDRYTADQVGRRVRLADVKPVALRNERDWATRLA